jgi:hypothetical protein
MNLDDTSLCNCLKHSSGNHNSEQFEVWAHSPFCARMVSPEVTSKWLKIIHFLKLLSVTYLTCNVTARDHDDETRSGSRMLTHCACVLHCLRHRLPYVLIGYLNALNFEMFTIHQPFQIRS